MLLWGGREEDNVFDFERPYIKGKYVLQQKKKTFPTLRIII